MVAHPWNHSMSSIKHRVLFLEIRPILLLKATLVWGLKELQPER